VVTYRAGPGRSRPLTSFTVKVSERVLCPIARARSTLKNACLRLGPLRTLAVELALVMSERLDESSTRGGKARQRCWPSNVLALGGLVIHKNVSTPCRCHGEELGLDDVGGR